jgi:hypothetical protein
MLTTLMVFTMQLTTSESYLSQPIAVGNDSEVAVAKLHPMIVACLLAVAVVFTLLSEGCEYYGGRPTDAYLMVYSPR